MDSEIRMFSDKKFTAALTAGFISLKSDGHFTDMNLVVDGKSIPCHRIILAAASPYFYNMLTSGMAESRSPNIPIKGTGFKTMSLIVEYLYSNTIMLTAKNVQNIFIASDLFQMNQLKYGCEKFMSTLVDPLNCIDFLHFACHFHTEILENAAKQCALDNFGDIIETPEFGDLSEKEMILMFSSCELNVPREDVAIEALIHWVGNDPKRKESLFRIIKHIRFIHCDPEFLQRLQTSIQVQESYGNTLTCNTEAAQENDPRYSYDKRVLVTVGDRNIGCIQAGTKNFTGWSFITEIPKHCDHFSACALPNGIVVSGGYRTYGSSNRCWLFKTDTRTWNPLPRLIKPRGYHVSLYLRGSVFVVGGITDGYREVDSIERLDMKKVSPWTEDTTMPDSLSSFCAVTCGQSIFVLGGSLPWCRRSTQDGWEEEVPSLKTLEYDVIEEVWCHRACLPEPCRSGGAVSFQDNIYIFGGNTHFCYSYEPVDDIWTSLASPARFHHEVSAIVLWRKKILVCGEQDSTFLDVYDPTEDKWVEYYLSLQGLIPGLDFHYLLHVNFP